MTGRLLRRLLALGFLGLWMAPGAGALAVGVHVALDHHDLHHDSALLEGFALAVAHGHHHDDVAPHHDHPASLDVPAGLAWNPHAAALPDDPAAAPGPRHGRDVAPYPRRRSPVALFRVHCSLLI